VNVSPRAGKPADPSMLGSVPKLVTAYYTDAPGPSVPKQGAENYAENFRGADHLRHILEEAQPSSAMRWRRCRSSQGCRPNPH
jgi:hypothetical protein